MHIQYLHPKCLEETHTNLTRILVYPLSRDISRHAHKQFFQLPLILLESVFGKLDIS